MIKYNVILGSNVEGLVLDAGTDTLYFTDYSKRYIAKVDVLLTSIQPVIQQGLLKPRGILLYSR